MFLLTCRVTIDLALVVCPITHACCYCTSFCILVATLAESLQKWNKRSITNVAVLVGSTKLIVPASAEQLTIIMTVIYTHWSNFRITHSKIEMAMIY